MSLKEAKTVCITGAAGRIGYSLIPLFCSGEILGKDQPINLHLLDIPPAQDLLTGITMEIMDCAYPLVRTIKATTDAKEGFTGVQVAAMVGGFPRKPGMLRKDLLDKNSPIFVSQGKALNDNADPDCKVVVVANPANTNCLQLQRHCPKIPKENFTALTRLDQNRAVAQIAAKLGKETGVDMVQNVAIWGNHSSTMVPDASRAMIKKEKILIAKVESKLESKWLESEFVTTVQTRGKAVLDAQKASSAMSAARAIADHLKDWLQGSGDRLVSMGVCSDGNPHEVKEGLIFSFPVKCFPGGKWSFVKELEISDSLREGLKKTEEELVEEAGHLDAAAAASDKA